VGSFREEGFQGRVSWQRITPMMILEACKKGEEARKHCRGKAITELSTLPLRLKTSPCLWRRKLNTGGKRRRTGGGDFCGRTSEI